MTDVDPPIPDLPDGFSALLELRGGEADHHQVRADDLVSVLAAMQRIAYLFAKADSGQAVGERVKPGRAERTAYALNCGVPQPGSYAVPMNAGDVLQPGLPLADETGNLLSRIQRVIGAVGQKNAAALYCLLPAELGKRALREIAKMLPHQREGISVSLWSRGQAAPAVIDWHASRFIKAQLEGDAANDAVMTVTGELLRIDFSARQVAILYPPTRREIVCTYVEEIEDSIVESRKDPIQVTGRFVLDEEGMPIRLTDVTRVEPVDLSPIIIAGLESPALSMKRPLELLPALDEESQQYLCVSDAAIHLDVFAQTRDALFDEVKEQLAMLWWEYAGTDDDSLDDEARRVKRALHELMEEKADAQA